MPRKRLLVVCVDETISLHHGNATGAPGDGSGGRVAQLSRDEAIALYLDLGLAIGCTPGADGLLPGGQFVLKA